MSNSPLDMIRYLMVFRVNAPMVWFHLFPSMEFSLALGKIIAESLPTVQARPWQESLKPWDALGGISLLKNKSLKRPPNASWPVDAVLFCYPGKRAYGEGELILTELKLSGEAADHEFFLEIILPAVEKASRTIDPERHRPDSLWGRFDIQDIYVARGHNWEPLVSDSRLNLRYAATPSQWSEGLDLKPEPSLQYRKLTWVTPFDLRADEETIPCDRNRKGSHPVPSLKEILLSLKTRLTAIEMGGSDGESRTLSMLEDETGVPFERVMNSCSDIPVVYKRIYPVLESQPGCWIGKQAFNLIPDQALPYLILASTFHIGAHTHFGCGTFVVE